MSPVVGGPEEHRARTITAEREQDLASHLWWGIEGEPVSAPPLHLLDPDFPP